MEVLVQEEQRAGISEAAFPVLVGPHWPSMVDLATRLLGLGDGEDAAQDALTKAWRDRATYDPDRSAIRTWLLMLTAEQVRRTLRRRRRRVLFRASSPPELNVATGDPDLCAALAKLSVRQRTAVELYYYLDLPVTEVAHAMGCSEGTVKSTLSDARMRLRGMLSKDET